MHGKDSSNRSETHRARLTFPKALALVGGTLPAGATLTLTAPQAGAAVAGEGPGSAAAEDFHQVRAPGGTTSLHLAFKGSTGNGALFDVDDFTFTTG
ncbi:hypothetical protein DI272_08855 [Streptomyces sp. Act143]|uniref:hypothetical protein n=1 Tax=Streptomyces sp. Act143 TaxID=2200760 RepID=UPI000D674B84|nr:hypothetical protein [Streptomyces sp. Act143]PWI14252.1 hypothetical protein DI272_08855 [Streptomyces sp. Act143]